MFNPTTLTQKVPAIIFDVGRAPHRMLLSPYLLLTNARLWTDMRGDELRNAMEAIVNFECQIHS